MFYSGSQELQMLSNFLSKPSQALPSFHPYLLLLPTSIFIFNESAFSPLMNYVFSYLWTSAHVVRSAWSKSHPSPPCMVYSSSSFEHRYCFFKKAFQNLSSLMTQQRVQRTFILSPPQPEITRLLFYNFHWLISSLRAGSFCL